MASFPTDITCVVTRGFSEGFPEAKNYLGEEKFVYPSTAKVTALIKTHADMEVFTRWYITDIAWGTGTFTISLPLFGVTRDWEVRLINKIDTKPNDKAAWLRDIPMELELIDDIDDYIAI